MRSSDDLERLFKQRLGFGSLLLEQSQLCQFNIAHGVFWIELDGLFEIRIRFIEGLVVAFRYASPDVGICEVRIHYDVRQKMATCSTVLG